MPETTLSLRVLGYLDEGGQWAAHCLETDLVGFGRTFDQALEALHELTGMQVSFAVFKSQPALLDHPAPSWIIETYNRMVAETLQAFPRPLDQSNRMIGCIRMPKAPKKPSHFVPTGA